MGELPPSSDTLRDSNQDTESTGHGKGHKPHTKTQDEGAAFYRVHKALSFFALGLVVDWRIYTKCLGLHYVCNYCYFLFTGLNGVFLTMTP